MQTGMFRCPDMDTLTGLAEDFTPEVEAAWIEVYNLLASVMKQAANAQKAS